MFSMFSNLPRPVQAMVMLAGGAGILSIGMSFVPGPMRSLFRWIALGILVLVLILVLFKLILWLRDKAKAKPFAAMLSKGGGGRAGADPAQKARMDDLRKKFEEGVATFKSAGKDLYSLPWYLLVGPAGSGKTEALRHCNVGFPPGLQDCLQGAGGTLNMHWWFTNHSVVIDTAGRMFMTEDDPEWKSFLKLLKTARPRCPINGLLLVISSESLLKDSSEKIEQTAGAIARQLDVVQRTLDVRFPVSVLVTKCDKIIGFRDFFETITSPDVQHQILGWSNPANLDEKFDPATVDKHLDSVRQRLIRRRYGLLQNPVHTSDANARRTDQVDEMFELPDNLMRIAPRLRRYLEMIFVAGEWSPKPLFLRGIYFTSSMREGQALDVSLAAALGVDVEAIPGGKEWDKDKSYFLRDVFLAKIFREKGLVTRAVNVSKTLQRQRTLLVGTALAATVIIGGLTVLGLLGFRSSLGPPSVFWSNVKAALLGDKSRDIDPLDLDVLGRDPRNPSMVTFRATDVFERSEPLGDVDTPARLLAETSKWAKTRIETPMIAKPIGPFLGFGDGFLDEQQKAHRALFERTTLVPLVEEVRSKLQNESRWGPDAVASLAQLVRLQTYAHGKTPAAEGSLLSAIGDAADTARGGKGKSKAGPRPAIDADVMFRYVLPEVIYTDRKAYLGVKDDFAKAVASAYPNGFGEDLKPSPAFACTETRSINIVSDATDRLLQHLLALGASEGSDMWHLDRLQKGLAKFREAESDLRRMTALQPTSGAGAGQSPRTLAEYAKFEQDAMESLTAMSVAKKDIDKVVEALGDRADDPVKLLAEAGTKLQQEVEAYFDQLIEQLPAAPEALLEGKSETLARAAGEEEQRTQPVLRELRTRLTAKRKDVGDRVKADLAKRETEIRSLASMVVLGRADRLEARAYAARWGSFEKALAALTAAQQPAVAAPEGTVRTLTMDFAVHAQEAQAWSEGADAWRAWEALPAGLRLLDDTQRRELKDAAADAARVAGRAVAVATDKRDYDSAILAIQTWPRDWEVLADRTRRLAESRLRGDDPSKVVKRLVAPLIPLSELDGKAEFDNQFHIETARETMGDYGQLRDLVEPGTSGKRRMLGADAIKEDRAYRLAREVTAEYARRFVAYWRTQALERSRASVASWEIFRTGIRDIFTADLQGSLEQVRDLARQAYDAVPESVRADNHARDREDLVASFAGLESKEFMQGEKDGLSEQLRNWKTLAARPATDARDELIKLWVDGNVRKRYFAAFRPTGRGLKYWNDVQLHGVRMLIDATQKDMAGARTTLLTASRGVPLVVGPESMPDLSAGQLRDAAEAVARLASATGGSGAASAVKDAELDEDVESLLKELSGANFVTRDEQTRTWFTKLSAVTSALHKGRAVTVQIAPNPSPPAPPRGGAGELGADRFRYARLYIDDTPVGEAFNLTTTMTADKADKLRLPLPLPEGKRASIGLFTADPPPGDKVQVKPAAEIQLPGAWHVLRAGLIDSLDGSSTDTGTWKVFVSQGGYYLWLDVTMEKDAKVPARSAWPMWREWPER
ncbi:MAG: hypothetical protein HBSAPP03_25090 [Phycisphaerae bacterium]|nr:MAG: hypothetical protein HBSAPP03_25090 [Phycisphaerae bacterium]